MKPDFSFCGYPVIPAPGDLYWGENYKPCGNIATPGCAYCAEHAEPPRREWARLAEEHNKKVKTKQDGKPGWIGWTGCIGGLLIAATGLYQPVHDWLHAHTLGFWAGVFVGSVLELCIILAGRWTWHRYGWLRWFDRMG